MHTQSYQYREITSTFVRQISLPFVIPQATNPNSSKHIAKYRKEVFSLFISKDFLTLYRVINASCMDYI
jgi:hypothetical protein